MKASASPPGEIPAIAARHTTAPADSVRLTDGRALISLDDERTLQTLELDVRDALDDEQLAEEERATLTGLADVLRQARRGEDLTLRVRTIIVLEPARPPKPRVR
jgi:hypothetical protein